MRTLIIILLLALPVKAINTPKMVYVEWIDIVATDSGWHTEDELNEWIESEPNKVHQTGFVFKETDEYIVLIDSFMTSEIKGTAVKIPKCVIERIEYK